MSPPEYVAAKYGKDLDWASRCIALSEQLERNADVIAVLCERRRDLWARSACGVASYQSPDYAYYRGKSDTYQDLSSELPRLRSELGAEFAAHPDTEKEELSPWQ